MIISRTGVAGGGGNHPWETYLCNQNCRQSFCFHCCSRFAQGVATWIWLYQNQSKTNEWQQKLLQKPPLVLPSLRHPSRSYSRGAYKMKSLSLLEDMDIWMRWRADNLLFFTCSIGYFFFLVGYGWEVWIDLGRGRGGGVIPNLLDWLGRLI